MTNTAALWYIESVNLYSILCPHKVKKMGEKHEYLRFKRDQFVYMPDESATHIYMVVNGRVKIGHYLENGDEVLTAILTKGEIFATATVATNAGDPVHFGATDGVLTNTGGIGPVPGARWKHTRPANELNVVQLGIQR